MRFTIQREAFLKPLKAVGGVVERRHAHNLPILSNVLIRVLDEGFTLTTTDQEVLLVSSGVFDEPCEKGDVTVPFRKLADIVRALPEGAMLSLSLEGDRILLRSGRSRFTLSILPANEFPNIEDNKEALEFSISKKSLKTLIEGTCFAMADQDVRYYLNGMLLEVKKGILYSVAADGHRLAKRTVTLSSSDQDKTVRVIVPRKGVLELQRVLEESDETITLRIGGTHIQAITGTVILTSQLLDGRFPDYERIIPKQEETNKIVVGKREILREAFHRAAALFSEKFRGVTLQLAKGRLKILATNAEQDEVEEDLEVEYQGSELEIGFNVKYLIDFLNIIQTENVKFTFSDPNSSARVEGVDGDSGVYVIMPMKI